MLALTMGDPAGIAGEITAAAWRARTAPFVLFGDPDWMAGFDVPVEVVTDVAEAARVFGRMLPVIEVALACPARSGKPDQTNAPAIIESIARATRATLAGETTAVVTNPISKIVLQRAGFPHPGHTEFLAELCGRPGSEVMMLASPMLRVVPVSIHLSLREAVSALDTASIVRAARAADLALRRDFGIARPRLAIAGLNPHAGEEGRMGDEERVIIAPAIAALRDAGIDATGPYPPDTLFTARMRANYDAAICMYHDQALIPIKALDIDGGVNVTLGLPIVRTSPDHGTAFDIAGQGRAAPDSLLAALMLADTLARHRAAS
jgi:4-hydroxythreonine-4-phosphate dehydrogenase